MFCLRENSYNAFDGEYVCDPSSIRVNLCSRRGRELDGSLDDVTARCDKVCAECDVTGQR